MNQREMFIDWMEDKQKIVSGKVSSYVRALDLLSYAYHKAGRISEQTIYAIKDIQLVSELYNEALAIQRDESSYIFNIDAPSYGRNGYYSASLKAFREYLIEKA